MSLQKEKGRVIQIRNHNPFARRDRRLNENPSLSILIPIAAVVQTLLAALDSALDVAKTRRPANLSLRIRLLGRVVVASLALLHGSIRL